MLIENVDYFVRIVQFPNAANKGIVCPNDDGTFDIYLNSLYPDLKEGYDHEVRHLLLDHFGSYKSIEAIEREAPEKMEGISLFCGWRQDTSDSDPVSSQVGYILQGGRAVRCHL